MSASLCVFATPYNFFLTTTISSVTFKNLSRARAAKVSFCASATSCLRFPWSQVCVTPHSGSVAIIYLHLEISSFACLSISQSFRSFFSPLLLVLLAFTFQRQQCCATPYLQKSFPLPYLNFRSPLLSQSLAPCVSTFDAWSHGLIARLRAYAPTGLFVSTYYTALEAYRVVVYRFCESKAHIFLLKTNLLTRLKI